MGVPPSGSGSRPSDRASKSVSPVPASIPNAGSWAADSRHAIRTARGKKVATADVWGPSWPEKKVNARLIAAAPELYAALELCLAMAQRQSLTGPRSRHGQSPYDIGIAALRKARGEA